MHGFASFLADDSGAWTAAQRKDFANRIMSASDRLDGLIQDALSYNKVILQEIPLGPVNLAKLVPGIIETYPNLHPDKADIIIDGPLPAVTGNEALLTQCFSNLLGNAVKFVAPGQKPRVRLRAEPAGAECRIWVEDNGIGVPKESQHRLFGMFQKLNQEYEGTGVGLALVRKVVERMGGTVGVDSEAGQGSRFWVQLHLAS